MKFAVKLVALAAMAASHGCRLRPEGRNRQDRSHRSLTGLSGPVASVAEPAQELPVLCREVQRREQPGRREVRGHRHRQQAQPAGEPERAEGGHRPGHPLHHPGQRLVGAHWRCRMRSPSTTSAIPARKCVYLNYAAVDPDLTNSKCSYWHFRFDADTSMKMEALTSFMKDQKDIKKVYLLNQNYSHGQQVAKYAKEDSGAQAPRHPDRRRRPAPAGAGARLRALRRQDQGLGRRHRDHRQLGLRPVAAGQGRQRRRLERQVLHLLRRRHRHAHRAGHQRRGPGLPDRLQPLQHGWTDGQVAGRVQEEVQRRLLHRLHDPQSSRRWAPRWPRPSRPIRSRWRPRWKACGSRASTARSRCARPTTSCSSRCT